MKPKLLFTLATIYLGGVGISLQAFPIMAFGLAPDAPASLIANLRVPASLLLAIAMMNWFARNSDASSARDAIFIGNTVAFTFVAIGDILVAIIPGADPLGWVFGVVNLVFAIAFFVIGRANMSTNLSKSSS
jgi:hypothetical protein